MTTALWDFSDLVAASGGVSDGAPSREVTGFTIDSRALQPGEVFVALTDRRDGHEFVSTAFAAGASAAIVKKGYVRQSGDGALIRVEDPQTALEKIGVASRARLNPKAKVVAVTGSVGKTGTKEMLRACLGQLGTVHASEKSFNNHFGVPLTLARMPKTVDFAVFEIGMNHAEEIRPLAKMVLPHAAIITTVEAVHLENFATVDDIADAKAEIFDGVVPGGTVVIKRDNPFCGRLKDSAARLGLKVSTFGFAADADVVFHELIAREDGSHLTVQMHGRRSEIILGIPGVHIAENALGVVATLDALGVDVAKGVKALSSLKPPSGRGARSYLTVPGGTALLIDESYNANPASMRAALKTLAAVSRENFPRRIAVLADMLELGPDADAMHLALQDAVDDAGVDLIFACGPRMKGLYDALDDRKKGHYAPKARDLEDRIAAHLRLGDVVMVKGSNGLRLQPLVAALQTRFPPA